MLKELSNRGGPPVKRFVAVCEQCGDGFVTIPSSKRRFCSHECADAGNRRPLAERFWKYVNKTETCWLWAGGTNGRAGYGHILADLPSRKLVYAHRVSWELANGAIPDGLWVLHNCPGGDNPSCVNPDHLYLGTNSDNIKDEIAKTGMSLRWRNTLGR